jgi:hypothetical protein
VYPVKPPRPQKKGSRINQLLTDKWEVQTKAPGSAGGYLLASDCGCLYRTHPQQAETMAPSRLVVTTTATIIIVVVIGR